MNYLDVKLQIAFPSYSGSTQWTIVSNFSHMNCFESVFHSNTSNFPQNLPSCDPSLYFLQRAEDFLNFESSSLVNEVLEINYEEKENSRMHYLCIRNKDVKQHERLVRDPCLEFFSVTFVIFRMLKILSILCKCSGKPEKTK